MLLYIINSKYTPSKYNMIILYIAIMHILMVNFVSNSIIHFPAHEFENSKYSETCGLFLWLKRMLNIN